MPDICQLEDFGFLEVTGIDAIKFLKGYTTCDLASLEEGQVKMGAICNIQGRMLTSFLVIRRGQDLMLRMHRPLVQPTIEFLGKYIVFSKAKLADISESYTCYGLLDPDPDSLNGPDHSVACHEGDFTINLGNRQEQWLCHSEPATNSDAAAWYGAEIEAGIAWIRQETSEKFLPQMFNYHQLDAIDFEKGCYLGQEIVARAQYRGELKRRLHRLATDSTASIGESVTGGEIVATSPGLKLAVLQNPEGSEIIVELGDGETVTAVPV